MTEQSQPDGREHQSPYGPTPPRLPAPRPQVPGQPAPHAPAPQPGPEQQPPAQPYAGHPQFGAAGPQQPPAQPYAGHPQFGAAGYQHAPAPRRRPVWPWIAAGGVVLVAAIVALAMLLPGLMAPVVAGGQQPSESATPAATEPSHTPAHTPSPDVSSPAASPEVSAPADDDFAARMEEREQFFEDQQQAVGVMLVAKTPAQIEFTTRQREYVESLGQTYTAEYEDTILALALNACETSILSGHRVDAAIFIGHVMTAPQIQAFTEGRDPAEAEQVTKNLTEIMRDGTFYLCPDDYPQWKAEWDAEYGG